MKSRHRLLMVCAGVLLATTGLEAGDYPSGPVDYVIPFSPGGESDLTARLQRPFFERYAGEKLVVKYKPGGGGAVAWAQLNRLSGDGHTIMGTNLPHIVLQPMQRTAGYRSEDLANVYFFQYTPDAILVRADSPLRTLEDLVAAAKAAPGAMTFSGSGTFTANHLAKERFDRLAGIETTYVPFKGTGSAVSALMAGRVKAEWGYSTMAAKHPERIRMLALATAQRHKKFPQVPTFEERGFRLVSGAYRGIAVPSSTPEDLREEISKIFAQINRDPKFVRRMTDSGFALIDVPYQQVSSFVKARRQEYAAVVSDLRTAAAGSRGVAMASRGL